MMKRQQLVIKLSYHYKTTLLSLLASRLSTNVIKTDCMNIIVSFENLFDLSVVLLQNAFETTSLFTDASRPRDFLPTMRLTADQITNKQCLLYCGSVFKYIVNGLYLFMF